MTFKNTLDKFRIDRFEDALFFKVLFYFIFYSYILVGETESSNQNF